MSTILEARDLKKHFRSGSGIFQQPDGRARGRRGELRRAARRDAGPRRRVRLRQVDASGGWRCACWSRPPARSRSTATTSPP